MQARSRRLPSGGRGDKADRSDWTCGLATRMLETTLPARKTRPRCWRSLAEQVRNSFMSWRTCCEGRWSAMKSMVWSRKENSTVVSELLGRPPFVERIRILGAVLAAPMLL